MPERLIYKYSLYDSQSDVAVWEREPSRELRILPPEQYAAYKQSQQRESDDSLNPLFDAIDPVLKWKNVNEVFLVNGHIEKSDANFVGNLTF